MRRIMAHSEVFLLAICCVVCLISIKGAQVTELERLTKLVKSLEEKVNQIQKQQKVETLQIDTLRRQTERFNSTTTSFDQQIDLLVRKVQNIVDSRVAFSASLAGSEGVFVGPSTNGAVTLVFKTVFFDTGNSYNRSTGIFTAPVKGAYHFTISTFGYNEHTSGGILVKNDRLQVSTWEFQGPDSSDSSTNTVILPLDVGDQVKVILWSNGQVFDNANHHSTFSGFLLFPL